MDCEDDMIMIIVGDVVESEENQTAAAIPIKEEPVEEFDESVLDPESILETAELHGQYLTFIKNENQNIKEEDGYYEYDYLDDGVKQVGRPRKPGQGRNANFEESSQTRESSSESDENETPDPQEKPRLSYVEQLRKNFPKMRKCEDLLVSHLTEMMKETKPPHPPDDFCFNIDEKFVCKYCDAESQTIPAARRHFQKKHGTRYLVCFACGATFKCTTGLYKHEKRCPAPCAPLVLKARGRYLGRKGRKRPYLTMHRFDPWGERAKGESKKRYYCSECPANFRNKEALRSHEYMHRGERPFRCDQCPAAYTSHVALRRHLQIHSDTQYICDVCGRCFKIKTTLIVHMNTHLPQRKYPCDRCDRRFAQKSALQHHINRDHLNIPPPLVCAACPKRFPRVSNLNAHMKAKHGLKVMTRRMFFKALPTMKDTELKEATIVFNQTEKFVTAPLGAAPEKINFIYDEESTKSEEEIEDIEFQGNETAEEYMIAHDGEMYTANDEGDKVNEEVIVDMINELVEVQTVPKKAAVKTSLTKSCELEFAKFVARNEEDDDDKIDDTAKTQTRIPRIDLSFTRTNPQNKTPKIDLTNIAKMHRKIKATCGRSVPDRTKVGNTTNTEEARDKTTTVDKPSHHPASKDNNLTGMITRGRKVDKTVSEVSIDSKKSDKGTGVGTQKKTTQLMNMRPRKR